MAGVKRATLLAVTSLASLGLVAPASASSYPYYDCTTKHRICLAAGLVNFPRDGFTLGDCFYVIWTTNRWGRVDASSWMDDSDHTDQNFDGEKPVENKTGLKTCPDATGYWHYKIAASEAQGCGDHCPGGGSVAWGFNVEPK